MVAAMLGMDRSTGAPLDGDAHLGQSIGDILTTPIGTRVMLRDYGSMLLELIDRPINAALRLLFPAASAAAVARWEPRARLTRVNFSTTGADGRVSLDIEGYRTDLPPGTNRFFRLSIPLFS